MLTRERSQHLMAVALATLVVLYALFAGLRTVNDPDTGWQLASGRYIVTHRTIPSTDVLSYTARGAPFIYPPLSLIFLYGLHAAGGYALLSWVGALCCAGVVLMTFAAAGLRFPVILLALISVPVIALRTTPRADLFTTLLAAGMLCALWRYHCGRRAPLWLLPVVMVAWVNLHLGFVTGLALIGAYLVAEASDLLHRQGRQPARARLTQAWPWLAAGVAATVVNPWGPRIYAALVRQNRTMQQVGDALGEWSSMRVRQGLIDAGAWRSPDSAFWWLLLASVAAIVVALVRRRFGAAAILLSGALAGWQFFRFQAIFAILVAVVGGTVLADGPPRHGRPSDADAGAERASRTTRLRLAVSAAVALIAIVLAAFRIGDLASNRQYLAGGDTALFGPGESWWFPERATDFLLREGLPANVFNTYNEGGFLTWKLGPRYPVYIDGRSVPFGAPVFYREQSLQAQPLDSPQWNQEADARGINTVIYSTARYLGLGGYPLKLDCESRNWTPVYLDEAAVIFVRNAPANAPWTVRLRIDCATIPFQAPATDRGAVLYNFYANAGSVLYVLERDRESAEMFQQARRIFDGDANLYLGIAQLLQSHGDAAGAERAYRTSLRLRQTGPAWYALARLYINEKRYDEAAGALERSAELSLAAADRYRELAQLYLTMNRPDEALRAVDLAGKWNPYGAGAVDARRRFLAQLASLRAKAQEQRAGAPH